MNALLRNIKWKINEDLIRIMINLIYIHKMCVIACKMSLNYNGGPNNVIILMTTCFLIKGCSICLLSRYVLHIWSKCTQNITGSLLGISKDG